VYLRFCKKYARLLSSGEGEEEMAEDARKTGMLGGWDDGIEWVAAVEKSPFVGKKGTSIEPFFPRRGEEVEKEAQGIPVGWQRGPGPITEVPTR